VGPPGGRPPGTVRFAGVTVRHPRDLSRSPDVSTSDATPPATLQVKDLVVGHGTPAAANATITVRYVDVLYADGTPLDSSWPRTARFELPSTVAGFMRGVGGDANIPPMRVGGRRIIVVPPDLGYGGHQQGNVPPNSTLIFVVDLKAVG
jgi:FKBP-type peptidyl-prolyl cis-trans isomerase